jgi:hypothetical protein
MSNEELLAALAERLGGFPALETGDCWAIAHALMPTVLDYGAHRCREGADWAAGHCPTGGWETGL